MIRWSYCGRVCGPAWPPIWNPLPLFPMLKVYNWIWCQASTWVPFCDENPPQILPFCTETERPMFPLGRSQGSPKSLTLVLLSLPKFEWVIAVMSSNRVFTEAVTPFRRFCNELILNCRKDMTVSVNWETNFEFEWSFLRKCICQKITASFNKKLQNSPKKWL